MTKKIIGFFIIAVSTCSVYASDFSCSEESEESGLEAWNSDDFKPLSSGGLSDSFEDDYVSEESSPKLSDLTKKAVTKKAHVRQRPKSSIKSFGCTEEKGYVYQTPPSIPADEDGAVVEGKGFVKSCETEQKAEESDDKVVSKSTKTPEVIYAKWISGKKKAPPVQQQRKESKLLKKDFLKPKKLENAKKEADVKPPREPISFSPKGDGGFGRNPYYGW